MVTPELLDYLTSQKQVGTPYEKIISSLVEIGWNKEEVEQALNSLGQAQPPKTFNEISAPADSVKTKRSPWKKIGIGLIIILIVLLVGGSGTFAYFFYFQPPAKVINKMVSKTSAIKALSYISEFTLKDVKFPATASDYLESQIGSKTDALDKSLSLTMKINGNYDYSNSKIPASSSTYEMSASGDLLSDIDINLNLETITVGQVIYLKLAKFPDFGLMNISKYKNKWIKIDLDEIQKQYGGSTSVTTTNDQLKLTTAEIKDLTEFIKINPFVEMKENLGSAKINNYQTFHYKFGFNEQNLSQLFLKVIKIVEKQYASELGGSSISDYGLSDTDFKEFFDNVKLPVGEVWIGKLDYYPYKISFASKIKDLVSGQTLKNLGSDVTGSFEFITTLDNYNQPQAVSAPKDAISYTTIMDEIYKGTAVDNLSGSDSSTDSDNDGLTDALESAYGTNPNLADTDGDGYNDKQEIDAGYDPNGPGKLQDILTN